MMVHMHKKQSFTIGSHRHLQIFTSGNENDGRPNKFKHYISQLILQRLNTRYSDPLSCHFRAIAEPLYSFEST